MCPITRPPAAGPTYCPPTSSRRGRQNQQSAGNSDSWRGLSAGLLYDGKAARPRRRCAEDRSRRSEIAQLYPSRSDVDLDTHGQSRGCTDHLRQWRLRVLSRKRRWPKRICLAFGVARRKPEVAGSTLALGSLPPSREPVAARSNRGRCECRMMVESKYSRALGPWGRGWRPYWDRFVRRASACGSRMST